MLARPERARRAAARARAERYDWDTAARGFLAVHGQARYGAEAETEIGVGAEIEAGVEVETEAEVEAGRRSA
jgi:alpha-1,6-mannosyltransferase